MTNSEPIRLSNIELNAYLNSENWWTPETLLRTEGGWIPISRLNKKEKVLVYDKEKQKHYFLSPSLYSVRNTVSKDNDRVNVNGFNLQPSSVILSNLDNEECEVLDSKSLRVNIEVKKSTKFQHKYNIEDCLYSLSFKQDCFVVIGKINNLSKNIDAELVIQDAEKIGDINECIKNVGSIVVNYIGYIFSAQDLLDVDYIYVKNKLKTK